MEPVQVGKQVQCPSCSAQVAYSELNTHLDRCLGLASSSRDPASSPTSSHKDAGQTLGQSQGLPRNNAARQSTLFGSPRSGAPREGAGTLTGGEGSGSGPRRAWKEGEENGASAQAGPSKRARLAPPAHDASAAASPSQTSTSSSFSRTHAHIPTARERMDAAAPFAERMRPRSLDEFVGQSPIVNGPLRTLVKQGKLPSMILWGPPGTGKTTLARLLARYSPSSPSDPSSSSIRTPTSAPAPAPAAPPHRFVELSATAAGTQDVRRVFDEARSRLQLTGQRTVLFIDEVQRFSRAQQDVFLPFVETGQIILIAATTENPSFRLQGALLSRMRVFVLTKLSVEECFQVLRNALTRAREELGYSEPNLKAESDKGTATATATETETHAKSSRPDADLALPTAPDGEANVDSFTREVAGSGETSGKNGHKTKAEPIPYERIDDDLLRWISTMADGDARAALSALELALATSEPGLPSEERISKLKEALKRTSMQYDRTGDMHYDTISALHKSIRGSDPDAALYWLARMVSSGDDPLFIARRLIVAASEDCDTLEALQMATATYRACQVVGLPECGENLAQCVVFLSESSKSTRSYNGWKKALSLVSSEYNHPVPIHIRNAPTRLMKDLGYAKEYRYEPRFAHPVHQEFFPPELKGTRFLSPPVSPRPSPHASQRSFSTRAREEGQGARGNTKEEDDFMENEDMPDHVLSGEPSGANGSSNLHEPASSAAPPPARPLPALAATDGTGPGSCQRTFSLGARAVDLELLEEWERERNGGRMWTGRRRLEEVLVFSGGGGEGKKERGQTQGR